MFSEEEAGVVAQIKRSFANRRWSRSPVAARALAAKAVRWMACQARKGQLGVNCGGFRSRFQGSALPQMAEAIVATAKIGVLGSQTAVYCTKSMSTVILE